MEKFLIICPLVFLAGFVDSIGGGGGIISLPAFLMAGLPPHTAIATNKLSSTLGTTASTARYMKNGYLRGCGLTAVLAALCSMAGSVIGAHISLMIPETVIRNLMLAVLPVVAIFVLRSKKLGDDEKTGTLSDGMVRLISVGAGLVIGLYDGIYGPGTGTFLLLIFTGIAHMPVKQASAQTKVINLSSNAAALLTFIVSGDIAYLTGLAGAACCIAGHYVGSGFVVKDGTKIVRPIVIAVLVLLFIKVLSGR